MTRTHIVSLQRRGTLVLPVELRRRHHLDGPGAQVRITEREDGILELEPLVAVPADQQWFWTQRWQQMEREADSDIADGRVASFGTTDDLVDDLDG